MYGARMVPTPNQGGEQFRAGAQGRWSANGRGDGTIEGGTVMRALMLAGAAAAGLALSAPVMAAEGTPHAPSVDWSFDGA